MKNISTIFLLAFFISLILLPAQNRGSNNTGGFFQRKKEIDFYRLERAAIQNCLVDSLVSIIGPSPDWDQISDKDALEY